MEQTSALMKDLTYHFGADIIELVLPSTKLENKDIDFFEPIILGIFLVGYAFYLSNSKSLGKEQKAEQINNFHQLMHNSLINDVCIGVYKIGNIEEIHNFSNNFSYLLDQRFMEYFPLIDADSKINFLNLTSSFAKYLFKEDIGKHEMDNFISHLNMAIALHLARMEEKLRVLGH
jgi:hypothetical protein